MLTHQITDTESAFNKEDYTTHKGISLNVIQDLTDITEILEQLPISDPPTFNTYGANVTVNYIAPYFKNITSFREGNMPLMSIGNYDYITLEIKIPENGDPWFDNHNLLHFTPYFFSIINNGQLATIFGSVDDSIFFVKKDLKPNSVIRVCITASKSVAAHFERRDDYQWHILRIPSDYNQQENDSTFNCALRLGTTSSGNSKEDTRFIQENVHFKYFQFQPASSDQDTFASDEIIKMAQPAGPAPVYTRETNYYDDAKAFIDSHLTSEMGYTQLELFPYLSNDADPPADHAIKTFYDSIELAKPVNCQADNSQENYFMSDTITFDSSTENDYLYILYANQSAMQAALTSNIQIYDSDENSHSCINFPGGTQALISTAADLPNFSVENYPHSDSDDPTDGGEYPLFGLYAVPIEALINANTVEGSSLQGIKVVERFSYNPVTLNYTQYSLCHTSKAYIGPQINDDVLQTLKTQFPDIDLKQAV